MKFITLVVILVLILTVLAVLVSLYISRTTTSVSVGKMTSFIAVNGDVEEPDQPEEPNQPDVNEDVDIPGAIRYRASIGDPCDSDRDCSAIGESAICEGICKSGLGGPCAIGTDCSSGLDCINYSCQVRDTRIGALPCPCGEGGVCDPMTMTCKSLDRVDDGIPGDECYSGIVGGPTEFPQVRYCVNTNLGQPCDPIDVENPSNPHCPPGLACLPDALGVNKCQPGIVVDASTSNKPDEFFEYRIKPHQPIGIEPGLLLATGEPVCFSDYECPEDHRCGFLGNGFGVCRPISIPIGAPCDYNGLEYNDQFNTCQRGATCGRYVMLPNDQFSERRCSANYVGDHIVNLNIPGRFGRCPPGLINPRGTQKCRLPTDAPSGRAHVCHSGEIKDEPGVTAINIEDLSSTHFHEPAFGNVQYMSFAYRMLINDPDGEERRYNFRVYSHATTLQFIDVNNIHNRFRIHVPVIIRYMTTAIPDHMVDDANQRLVDTSGLMIVLRRPGHADSLFFLGETPNIGNWGDEISFGFGQLIRMVNSTQSRNFLDRFGISELMNEGQGAAVAYNQHFAVSVPFSNAVYVLTGTFVFEEVAPGVIEAVVATLVFANDVAYSQHRVRDDIRLAPASLGVSLKEIPRGIQLGLNSVHSEFFAGIDSFTAPTPILTEFGGQAPLRVIPPYTPGSRENSHIRNDRAPVSTNYPRGHDIASMAWRNKYYIASVVNYNESTSELRVLQYDYSVIEDGILISTSWYQIWANLPHDALVAMGEGFIYIYSQSVCA